DAGTFDRARRAFEEAGREDGTRESECAYWAAKCCLRLEEPQEAARRLTAAIAASPASPLIREMRYDLAVALLRGGRKDEAASAFESFRADFPTHPLAGEAGRLSASLALERGDPDRALAIASELLKQKDLPAPSAAAARLTLAQAHASAGHEREAIT